MHYILDILRFGAPYLRRYWLALAAGVVFSIIFGLSNGGLVWGTKTILERLNTHVLEVSGDTIRSKSLHHFIRIIEKRDVVSKVDTDANRDVSLRYGISAIPTVILFRNGQVAQKFVGVRQEKEFKEVLDAQG